MNLKTCVLTQGEASAAAAAEAACAAVAATTIFRRPEFLSFHLTTKNETKEDRKEASDSHGQSTGQALTRQ